MCIRDRYRGDILFTNYGVSGPPILQLSGKAGELMQTKRKAQLRVILIDSMSRESLNGMSVSYTHLDVYKRQP